MVDGECIGQGRAGNGDIVDRGADRAAAIADGAMVACRLLGYAKVISTACPDRAWQGKRAVGIEGEGLFVGLPCIVGKYQAAATVQAGKHAADVVACVV